VENSKKYNMNKLSREQAEVEVNSWLDHKKISAKKREAQRDQIESLVCAMEEGVLILNENKVFIHELLTPIGSEAKITKLEFAPRISIGSVHKHLEGVKSDSVDGRILAYVAALTSNTKDVIKKLDTEDYGICQSIAIFFL